MRWFEERVLIFVKALPHVGERHGETVCCAGGALKGEWRRQYPMHFRRLRNPFARWQWIEVRVGLLELLRTETLM